MAQTFTLPRPSAAPALQGPRLPLKALTAITFFLALIALSAVVPTAEVSPDMAWRGNAGSLEQLR